METKSVLLKCQKNPEGKKPLAFSHLHVCHIFPCLPLVARNERPLIQFFGFLSHFFGFNCESLIKSIAQSCYACKRVDKLVLPCIFC